MCILFIYAGGKIDCKYRLILASNRDEYFKRPASKAAKWEEDNNVIGGRDMEPGHEGGTWLAASPARNKIGVLLNLPGVPVKKEALGRGAVVSDYVLSETPTVDYINRFRELEYRPFNLVTVEISNASCNVNFFSNFDKNHTIYSEGILGFGNSLPDAPLKKVSAGKVKFEGIVNNYANDYNAKNDLVNELIKLLKWNESHLPDEELFRRNPKNQQELSSVFVNIPQEGYGTRAHTIILVDLEGNMEFWEWTMVPEQTEWFKTYLKHEANI